MQVNPEHIQTLNEIIATLVRNNLTATDALQTLAMAQHFVIQQQLEAARQPTVNLYPEPQLTTECN